jgi:Protein of unknown function (DUF3107)
VEVKVGIRQVNREIVLDTNDSAADVEKAFHKAVSSEGIFTLTDERGRKVLIPSAAIGYVDIGEENVRHVGFGSV